MAVGAEQVTPVLQALAPCLQNKITLPVYTGQCGGARGAGRMPVDLAQGLVHRAH